MIGVICEESIGFSKRGKCHGCGGKHTKEVVIGIGFGFDKYIKLCDECYKELKERMKAFD